MDLHIQRHRLFPEISPANHGFLERDGGHAVYWEECGSRDGIPVVFLHGGPGAGAAPVHRRFFDPESYRIVVLDQRGAGRSRPLAATEANTTWDLVGDIEALRQSLGIDRWLIFGGSWGATLALAYGGRHPERCLGFILRGVFLGRPEEVDWFLHGMGRVFPEAALAFREFLPENERDDLLAGYYRRLFDPDPSVHLAAARAWTGYETACSTLRGLNRGAPHPSAESDRATLGQARVSIHYFMNRFFLEQTPLLDQIAPVVHLPATIVQGRYDIVCPMVTADTLTRAWPGSEMKTIPDAGHSALEPGIRAALVAATEDFKLRL